MAGLSCDLWEVINCQSDAAVCEINFRQKRKQDPRETLDQVIFFLPINSFIAVATKQSFIQSLKFNLENKMEITFLDPRKIPDVILLLSWRLHHFMAPDI